MTEFFPADAALVLLIGMGPFKAVLVYMGATAGMEADVKRRIAMKMVTVAGVVAVGLFVLGKAVQELLHFSDAALIIAAGLILLLLGLRMAMGGGAGGGHEGGEVDPDSVAIFPLALPLTLNPIGIVALISFSTTVDDLGDSLILLAIIAGVLVIDFVVFLYAGRAGDPNPQAIAVVEIVLGILLAALAVQLILVGLEAVGVTSGVTYK